MDQVKWKGWEHERKPMYCFDCGGVINPYPSGATDCDEHEHEEQIQCGFDFCGYCAKEFSSDVKKFTDPTIRNCPKCGNMVGRNKFLVETFGKHGLAFEDAIFKPLKDLEVELQLLKEKYEILSQEHDVLKKQVKNRT